jgi:glyoxylase-like metal-dependent hydrolase (beta-lactamase superfamily II)
MRVHHLNCISSCPLGGRLMDGLTNCIACRGKLCCHCLLIETDSGLVLVDSGFGLQDVRAPRRRLSALFLALLSPDFREEMTAIRQVEALGFDPADVRHVVLTHLDFDHAGGISDFPNATVHLMRGEHDYARLQKTWLDRQRFRLPQWAAHAHWRTYATSAGERWFGLDSVRQLDGLPPEILLVPLPGHTFGHAGVAARMDDGRWVLLAGDAYFFHREMDALDPWCTPGLRAYQALMDKDRAARLRNQQRLRDLKLAHARDIDLCCSHEMLEFEAMVTRAAQLAVDETMDPSSDPDPLQIDRSTHDTSLHDR